MNDQDAAKRAEAAAKRAEEAAKRAAEKAAEVRDAATGGAGKDPGKYDDEE